MNDVEQTKKMVPLITREITFGQHVSKLVLGVNIFDLDFGGSNNQANAILWALDTCPIVGLLSFSNHLDYRFTVFKNIKLGSDVRRFCVCGDMIHISQFINVSVFASFF